MQQQTRSRALIGIVAVALTAPLVTAAPAGAAAPDGVPPGPPLVIVDPVPDPQPEPTSCQQIGFEEAEVVRRRGSYQLVVSGWAPYWNMDVRLVPATYVTQPEYWEIFVEGCIPGDVGLPALRPYTVTLDLEGTMGTKGIQVGDETFDLRRRPPGRK